MIAKLTEFHNGSSSCIDLMFISNVSVKKMVELISHFMKNITVTSYADL